jgi:hypothetical protein
MLLSDSSMATVEFFDLPFDVIEIILTFLVMRNGCSAKRCLRDCLAFMSCCKRAKSYVFRANLSVRERIVFTNIFDVPPRDMVNLLTRWGVEFDFSNQAKYGDSRSVIEKKCSLENASVLDVFPKLATLSLCNITQLKGMALDFTKFYNSELIIMALSNLLKVNFGGCHYYNYIRFSSCSFGYEDCSKFVITVSGGTFGTISFSENWYTGEQRRLFPRGLGSNGIKHLIIENTGNTVATIEILYFRCTSIEKITLRGGVKINRTDNESFSYTTNPIQVDASNNVL